jgi:hypothetical protein
MLQALILKTLDLTSSIYTIGNRSPERGSHVIAGRTRAGLSFLQA